MRKLWFRRKGVSTMIGGIIVLSIFLTALGAMVYVSQEYDAYQNTVNMMSQKDIDRFSENLQVVYPGVSNPSLVSCSGGSGGQCDQYTITINNLAGIGTQIARIYIGSPSPSSLCSAGFCILDGASTSTVNRFSSTTGFIDPSEHGHTVSFWLGTAFQLASGSFSLVTTRGRIFSFQFPFPPAGPLSGSLSLGCVQIYFDPVLFTYDSGTNSIPATGYGGAPPLSGGWIVPGKTNVLYFIRLSNICESVVKLLDRTEATMFQYTGTGLGSPSAFFIIAPMDQSYCEYFPPSNGQSVYCMPTNQGGTTGRGNTYPQSNSVGYSYNATGSPTCNLSTNPCYELPSAPSQGQPSPPVYVLFGAVGEAANAMTKLGANPGLQFAVFLAIYWECETTTAGCTTGFEFGVTLPFISFVTS